MNTRSTARRRILDAVDRFRQTPDHPDTVPSTAPARDLGDMLPSETMRRLAAHRASTRRSAASNDNTVEPKPSQTIRRLMVHCIDHMETMHDVSRKEARRTVCKRISMPTMRISMEFAAGLL